MIIEFCCSASPATAETMKSASELMIPYALKLRKVTFQHTEMYTVYCIFYEPRNRDLDFDFT